MLRRFAAVFFVALATPVMAQQPPQFAPYTMGAQEHQWLVQQLGEIPAKWSVPILQGLEQIAQNAARQAAAEAARKHAAEGKPAEAPAEAAPQPNAGQAPAVPMPRRRPGQP